LKTVPEEGQQPKLKSCLKKPNGSKYDLYVSSDQESSQGSSPRLPCDASSTREQSSTRSGTSRSIESKSQESRGSQGSSSIRRRTISVEQTSCTSENSSVDNAHSSQNSERSYHSCTQTETKKTVRFNAIQIRDYERVVGDNPSCTSGPPLS
jgi:hypothetical protein